MTHEEFLQKVADSMFEKYICYRLDDIEKRLDKLEEGAKHGSDTKRS